jgi:hypothetical protein
LTKINKEGFTTLRQIAPIYPTDTSKPVLKQKQHNDKSSQILTMAWMLPGGVCVILKLKAHCPLLGAVKVPFSL